MAWLTESSTDEVPARLLLQGDDIGRREPGENIDALALEEGLLKRENHSQRAAQEPLGDQAGVSNAPKWDRTRGGADADVLPSRTNDYGLGTSWDPGASRVRLGRAAED